MWPSRRLTFDKRLCCRELALGQPISNGSISRPPSAYAASPAATGEALFWVATLADLAGGGIPESEAVFLATGRVGDAECYLLAYPASGDAAVYGRQTVWIDRADYIVRRIDYEDLRGRLLKTLWLAYGSDEQALRYGHARHLRMGNHRNGGQTLVEWQDVSYGADLDERLFDPRMLSDVRPR